MAMRALDAPHGVVERAAELALERLEGEHAIRVAELIRRYWERVAPDDLLARDPADLFGAAMAHWQTGARRLPDQAPNVRLYNPDLEVDGWESRHTVVEVVCDDRPFLVDSVTMVLQRHGWGIHLVVHPVLDVERTADGELVGLGGDTQESWIHLEVDRQASPESALDRPPGPPGRARRRPVGGHRLAGHAVPGRRPGRRAGPFAGGGAGRGTSGGQGAARLDGGRPLHLPRLPGVRAGRRPGGAGGAARRARHRPRRAPRRQRPPNLTAGRRPARAGAGPPPRADAAAGHQGQRPQHRPPARTTSSTSASR